MRRAALIVNPFASAVDNAGVAAVERVLAAEFEVTVTRTAGPGHATEVARATRGLEAVFVYGGDGLLNEVVNGVDGSVAIGVLPGGGTNVVARTLGLPVDAVEAARRLLDARPRLISLGRVNGRRFAFSAGIGFDAELVRRVDARGRRRDGRRPGDLAFAWEAAKLLAGRRGRYEPALEIERLGRAAFAFVANSDPYSYAAGRPLRVAPEARFELGLDLVAPRRVTPWAIPRLLRYAFRGRGQQDAADVVYAHDLDRIEIRCARPLPLQADGEDLGDVEQAVFEVERGAVSLLQPR